MILVPEAEDAEPTERLLATARRAAEQAATVRAQIANLEEQAGYQHQLEQDLYVAAEQVAEKQRALDAAKETVVDLDAANARAWRWKTAVSEARGLIEKRRPTSYAPRRSTSGASARRSARRVPRRIRN
jgi:hypothetical protein